MMQLTTTFVLLAIAAAAAATPVEQHPQPRMMGGTVTVSGQFPSTVYIETPQQPSCVGVIVNQNHVLTSGQCVINSATNNVTNPFFIRIIAGDLNLFQPSYRRFTTRATHIFVHPQYIPATGANDIAVVRVLPAFPFPHNTIDLIPRNTRVLADGTTCSFAGWGQNNNGVFNAIQQSLNLPILNRNVCNGPTVHANRVTESMICAGSLAASNPPIGVCNGNIGGGLYCNDQLVGILSFGLGCGAPNVPGVYTQVRFFETWIVQQFSRNGSTFP